MPDTPRTSAAPTGGGSPERAVRKIVVPPSQSMVALLGSRDEVLATVERVLSCDVHVRGNEITLTGTPSETAVGGLLFEHLLALLDVVSR